MTMLSFQDRFLQMVKQVPVGISIFSGPDFMVEMANEAYLNLVDKTAQEFIGKPLFDVLPEVKESVQPFLAGVYATGIPYQGIEFPARLNRYGKEELAYFNFVYDALRDEQGKIWGVIVVANDVTEQVKARYALTESEKQFRKLVMESPVAMTTLRGKQHVIEMANTFLMEKIWRRKEAEVIGQRITDVFPELWEQKYPQLLDRVFETGVVHQEKESIAFVQGDDGMQMFYLDYLYAPLFEQDGTVSGVMIIVYDVTAKVIARQKVEEAEERLRLAVEATGLGTWELDLTSGHLIHSPGIATIFGYEAGRVLQHADIRGRIHPDDEQLVSQQFAEMATTHTYIYEARIIRTDQSLRWISTRGKAVLGKDDQPVRLIGTTRDITDEKIHQQELEERELRFRLLADSISQLVWTISAEGVVQYANKSFFDYYGHSLEDINLDWRAFLHPDDQERMRQEWRRAAAAGDSIRMETRCRRYDGVYRWMLSQATPQKDAAGHIQTWIGTSTDIQEQKVFAAELEKEVRQRTGELQEKNQELKMMNAELKSFAYVSSHDLQEPLRKIQTFASRIESSEADNLSEKGKLYFDKINQSAVRMQTLIEDLLAYSRTSTAGRNFEQVDLGVLISEVWADMKEAAGGKDARVLIEASCKVKVIPFQFRQLLQNLISNSLKFARPGVAPYIRFTAQTGFRDGSDYYHLKVQDNGIGFEQVYEDRIFEVFQRLHQRESYKGTGIGLAIVKKIVENHGGFITATGNPGEGACFDIYIPVA